MLMKFATVVLLPFLCVVCHCAKALLTVMVHKKKRKIDSMTRKLTHTWPQKLRKNVLLEQFKCAFFNPQLRLCSLKDFALLIKYRTA